MLVYELNKLQNARCNDKDFNCNFSFMYFDGLNIKT